MPGSTLATHSYTSGVVLGAEAREMEVERLAEFGHLEDRDEVILGHAAAFQSASHGMYSVTLLGRRRRRRGDVMKTRGRVLGPSAAHAMEDGAPGRRGLEPPRGCGKTPRGRRGVDRPERGRLGVRATQI
jgi:2-keto-4-pentenoate hydratase